MATSCFASSSGTSILQEIPRKRPSSGVGCTGTTGGDAGSRLSHQRRSPLSDAEIPGAAAMKHLAMGLPGNGLGNFRDGGAWNRDEYQVVIIEYRFGRHHGGHSVPIMVVAH